MSGCHGCKHEDKSVKEQPCRGCIFGNGGVGGQINFEAMSRSGGLEDAKVIPALYLRDDQLVRPDSKPTNPKDAIGTSKLNIGLVPDTAIAAAALAFTEGALKYGRFNWRIAGVRASIYNDALRRHLAAWWNGEDSDPVTGVPHLASVIACASILLDSSLCGKLTDDRPPSAPVGDYVRGLEQKTKDLKELFKDHNPHQYTIKDTQA